MRKSWLIVLCALIAHLALATAPCLAGAAATEKAEAELFRHLNTSWTGDLDSMKGHRYIRVLVTYSRTNFFLDGAATKGLTAESLWRWSGRGCCP